MTDTTASDALRLSRPRPPRPLPAKAPGRGTGSPAHTGSATAHPGAAARAAVVVGGDPRPAGSSRRETILDAAAEMFAEHGYHGSSLRKIAGRAGVSHSGMLHHFSTKEDLLGAVIDRLEEHAQEVLDDLETLRAGIGEFERALGTCWHPGSHLIRLLATLDAEAVSRDHPGRFRLARLHRVHEHALEQCFVSLQECGMLRADIEPPFASRSMLALILNHAGREGTVRTMQHEDHGDAPVADLRRLLHSYLQAAEDAGALASVRPLKPDGTEGA